MVHGNPVEGERLTTIGASTALVFEKQPPNADAEPGLISRLWARPDVARPAEPLGPVPTVRMADRESRHPSTARVAQAITRLDSTGVTARTSTG